MPRRVLLLAVLLGGCGASAPGYSFPGCPDSDPVACAASPTFVCAQDTLIARHATCAADADCAVVQVSVDCLPGASCGFAVNASEAGAFRDELLNEGQRYCAAQPQGDGTSLKCGPVPAIACAPGQVAFCDAGTCDRAWSSGDAGVPSN
jgi:hypothetical protein